VPACNQKFGCFGWIKAFFSKSRIRTIVSPEKKFSVGQESETKTLEGALPSIRSVPEYNQKAGCFGWVKRLFPKARVQTIVGPKKMSFVEQKQTFEGPCLPKIIHRVWVGEKDISKEHLYNILLDAHFNPEHRIIIHTDRIKSIVSVLDEMKSYEEQLPQFRKMAKKYASRIEIKTIDELAERLKEKGYSSAAKLMAAAERERYPGSPYCNQAAASDCYRLAALYVDGGIYKDTDVMSQWAFPKSIYPKHGFMMVACNGYSNNVLMGEPKAFLIKECMDEIVSYYSSYKNTIDTWNAKRSVNETSTGRFPRLENTMAATGPDMIFYVLSYSMEGKFSKIRMADYYKIGGHSISFLKMREDQTEKHIPAKTKTNDILFANYQAGPDCSGLWTKIPPIKRRAIESPF